MNKKPSIERQEEDCVDDHYRHASALNESRPSEAVRQAIVAHAAKLAAERTAQRPVRSWPARSWWNPALFGSIAAAAIVGLVVAPQLFPSDKPVHIQDVPSEPDRVLPLAPPSTAAREKSVTPDRTESATTAKAAAGAVSAAPATIQAAAAPSARAQQATDAGKPRTALEHPDINATDADGRTALTQAVVHNQLAAVEELLRRGADPNLADAVGQTPLQLAVANHQPAIIAILKRAGAR